jgi:acyl-CoA thioester hydrolase
MTVAHLQKPEPETIGNFKAVRHIATRWMDNDVYGHVNNVVYYSWFDTAVNAHLMEQGALDIAKGDVIGLVVETHCNYFSPVSFPQVVRTAIRVAHMGTSSVRYEVGIFGDSDLTAARGHFVHVYVNKATRRPVALPDKLKSVLELLR